MSAEVPSKGHDDDQLVSGSSLRQITQSRPKYYGTPSSHPFLPRDVFRLIMRLEGQINRNSEVDTRSLEQAFHVPRGFYDSDAKFRHEQKRENPTGPGPGAYEIPDSWQIVDSSYKSQYGMSTFLSKTQRTTFQSSSSLSDKASEVTVNPSSFEIKSNAKSSSKAFISSVDRGLCSSPKSKDQPHQHVSIEDYSGTGAYDICLRPKTFGGPAFPFPRAERSFEVFSTGACTSPDVGPARYNVPRIWEAKESNSEKSAGNVMSAKLKPLEVTKTKVDTTTPAAVFGASTAPREIMWSPLYRPFSNALPESFAASEHYQRQKTKLLKELTPQKKKLSKSTSTPQVSKVRLKDIRNSEAARPRTPLSADEKPFDPFDWLRRRPQGVERANLLAVQYGLTEFVQNEPQSLHTQHQQEHEQNDQENHNVMGRDGEYLNMDKCQVSQDLSDGDGDDETLYQTMQKQVLQQRKRVSIILNALTWWLI
jgi:hypothetical protein